MPIEVIGRGLLAGAFASAAMAGPDAIICASGVSDSGCTDESAFQRERQLLRELTKRAQERAAVLVYFSGAPVYGRTSGSRVESQDAAPETPYGRHKLNCEKLVADSDVSRWLVLRLPNVVGSRGHERQLIPSLVAQALSGCVLTLADATRDLLDVDDLVIIVAALLRRGVSDSILNVASGISTPVPRVVEVIAEVLGTSPSVILAEGGDSQDFSIAKVQSLLPDYPRFEPDYPVRVLSRRVPELARSLRDGVRR